MTEISKPKIDFTNLNDFTDHMQSAPVSKDIPEAAKDTTMSVSDFKAARAEDLETVFEHRFGDNDYMKAVAGNVEDYASDEIIDRLRQDAMTFSGFGTAAMLEKAPQEVKDAYGRILQDWENTDPEGFEYFGSVVSGAKHFFQDPLNVATMMVGGPKLPLAMRAAVGNEAAKRALQFAASNSRNAMMTKAAVAGAGWTGVGNASEQAVHMAADIQKEFDMAQSITATTLGTVGGGALGRFTPEIGEGLAKGLYFAGRGYNNIFRSRLGDANIRRSVDEEEVELNLVNETGTPTQNEISAEEVKNVDLEFKDDVEELLMSVAPSPEQAQKQARFNAKQSRQASKEAQQRQQEDTKYGGFVSDADIEKIAEQYDIDRLELEEVIFDYEATRDLPNIDDLDDELMEEMGEVFYGMNKAKQSREFAIASFSNYMRNRKKGPDAPSENVTKALDELTIVAQEAGSVEIPKAITAKAQAFTSKIGGSEQTQAEVADTLLQVERGVISPDNARAMLLKKTQTLHGKVLFGRPTKVLTKFSESPSALRLAEIMRYDANQTYTSETRQVGMDYNETWKDYAGALYAPLIRATHSLRDASHGGLKDIINTELVRALRGSRSQSEDVNKAASLIRRDVLNQVIAKNEELGFETDVIPEDYFPRLWNRKALMKDFYGQRIVVTDAKRAELAGKGQNRFAKLLIEDGEAENMDEAKAIIEGMLKKKNDTAGPSGASHVAGNSFFTARKFNSIKDDNKYEDFLDNDIENVLFQYITQSANSYSKRKVFGVNNVDEFTTKFIDPIKREVEAVKNTFTDTDKEHIQDLYKSMTGEGLEDFGPAAQFARDGYATLIRMSTLAFATVSSLPEVLLNMQKAGTKEMGKGFGQALAQGTELMTNGLRRKLGKQGLSDPEIFHEMRESFLMLENASVSAADRLGDSSIAGHGFKKANRAFFKMTLLDGWTKTVQLASYNTGKSLIHKNLTAIKNHGALPDSKRIKNLRNQLAELNVDIDQGIAYLNRNSGEINSKDPFYKNIKRGAGRYVNEVILDTSPRAAIKPIWMSDPKKAIFAELLGYPTAFTNKVLKQFVRAIAGLADNPVGAANTLATAITMTAAATGLNYVRNSDSFSDKSGAEIAAEGVARWGGAGILLDMVQRTQKTYDVTGNPFTATASLAGPLASDAARGFSYGKIGPIIGGRMPFYGAIDPIMGEDIKEDYDDFWESFEKKKRRAPYDKGGLVEVESAASEPDERIDKVTGRPYDSQAGDAFIDQEDREERSRYVVGGLTRAATKALSPFVNELAQTILGETKKNNVKVSTEGAVKVAKNIEETYASPDPDLPAELDDPDFKEMLFAKVKSSIGEKHDLSMSDMRKEMPEFIDEKGALRMGDDFSRARGYSKEQIKNYNRDMELSEQFDMEGANTQDIDYHLAYELDTIGARNINTNWEYKFDNYYKGVAQTVGRTISTEEVTKLIAEFTPEERTLARKIFSRMPRQALPTDPSGKVMPIDYTVSPEIREANKKAFIAASKEKQMQYRAVASGFSNEFEEAVGMPNETGLHVGTQTQAERMALFRRQGDEDAFDEDSGLTSRQISNRLKKPLKKGEAPPPIAMMRGFIQVKNPLELNDPNFALYSDASVLFDTPDTIPNVVEAVFTQAPNLNASKFRAAKDNLYQKVLDFEAWQDEVTGGTLNKNRMSEKDLLVERMKKADINLSFRKMLEDQGFDSIRYLNTSDTPADVPTDEAFSYILFKPGQFKTESAIEFDPNDARHNFESGGKVLKALRKGRAA